MEMLISNDTDSILQLLRWKHTRHGHENDNQLLQTGFQLLTSSNCNGKTTYTNLLQLEKECNVSWSRLLLEIIDFAIFLISKGMKQIMSAKIKALELLDTALVAWELLQQEMNENSIIAAVMISTNSCNLLLNTMAEVLTTSSEINEKSNPYTFVAVNLRVLRFLFGLNITQSLVFEIKEVPTFHLYKPPTNVYTSFLQSILAYSSDQLQNNGNESKHESMQEVCGLMFTSLLVFRELVKAQMNKKKVFIVMAKTLLRSFAQCRYNLCVLCEQLASNVSEVPVKETVALLDEILVETLCDPENIRNFDNAYIYQQNLWGNTPSIQANALSGPQKKKQKANATTSSVAVSHQKQLFEELFLLLSDEKLDATLRNSIGKMLHVLLQSYATQVRSGLDKIVHNDMDAKLRSNRKRTVDETNYTGNDNISASQATTPFPFWVELCAITHCSIKSFTSDQQILQLTRIYQSLFESLSDLDIYRNTEDSSNRTNFYTLESIITGYCTKILSTKALNPTKVVVQGYCDILSNAVKCVPNILSPSLHDICELFGTWGYKFHIEKDWEKQEIICTNLLVLFDVHDSMRLVDSLLKAIFQCSKHELTSTTDIREGLYILLKEPQCEAKVKGIFANLPGGQLHTIWTLLLSELSSEFLDEDFLTTSNTSKVALVRIVFQYFLQQLHVTPQNRSQIATLLSQTYDKLMYRLKKSERHLKQRKSQILAELWSLFGYLLLLYDSVYDPIYNRASSNTHESNPLQQIISILITSDGINISLINSILSIPASNTSERYVGIIKVGVHLLRTCSSGEHNKESQLREILLNFAINHNCWGALAFDFVDLLNSSNIRSSTAKQVFTAILDDFIHRHDSTHIFLADAAFYEIEILQAVAIPSLCEVVSKYVNILKVKVRDTIQLNVQDNLLNLVEIFSILPHEFLDSRAIFPLVKQLCDLHLQILQNKSIQQESKECIITQLCNWLITTSKVQSIEFNSKNIQEIRPWIQMVMQRAKLPESVMRNVYQMQIELVAAALNWGNLAFQRQELNEMLSNVLKVSNNKHKIFDRVSIVLQAIAWNMKARQQISQNFPSSQNINIVNAHKNMESIENAYLSHFLKMFEASNFLSNDISDVYFQIMEGLIRCFCYMSTSNITTVLQRQLKDILSTQLPRALSISLSQMIDSGEIKYITSNYYFYFIICEEYNTVIELFPKERAVQIFGLLLTQILSMDGKTMLSIDSQPLLECIIASISKSTKTEEFQVLLSTIHSELLLLKHSCDYKQRLQDEIYNRLRVCLEVLHMVIINEHTRKQYRKLLADQMSNYLALCLDIFNPLSSNKNSIKYIDIRLQAASLRAIVDFFTSDIFSWRLYELTSIYIAFQPLMRIASKPVDLYNFDIYIDIWNSSYRLLLRIFHHYFASFVSGIPQLIQYTTALLKLLISIQKVPEIPQKSQSIPKLSSNLARLYGSLKPHASQLRKHVVYLIFPVIDGIQQLSYSVQQQLHPGIFVLLDICTVHEKEQLFASLDTSGKSFLKSLDSKYKLNYRFEGKV